MARPKKGEEKWAKAQIGLRLPVDLREDLERLAAANDRTLTDEVLHALKGYVGKRVPLPLGA